MLKKLLEKMKNKLKNPAPKFQFLPIEQVGNWQLEMNRPFGFIVRCFGQPIHEYHFHFQSNGWVTGVTKHKKSTQQKAFNSNGEPVGQPILVDKDSCIKYARFIELQKKGNAMTHDETKELLTLTGILKGD